MIESKWQHKFFALVKCIHQNDQKDVKRLRKFSYLILYKVEIKNVEWGREKMTSQTGAGD